MLTLLSDEGQPLSFQLVDSDDYESAAAGLVEVHWPGMDGTGYTDAIIAELWRDDIAEWRKPDGSVAVHLGRWHTLPHAEAERLSDWLDLLLSGLAQRTETRRERLSALAEHSH